MPSMSPMNLKYGEDAEDDGKNEKVQAPVPASCMKWMKHNSDMYVRRH